MNTLIENYDIGAHTTFRAPATARWCLVVREKELSEEQLQLVQDQQHIIIGDGSNLFFTDDFGGIVIKNEIKGKTVKGAVVTAGGGENWDDFVVWTLERGLFGLENLSFIPGTVGAAPVQNIGAYGMDVNERIISVTGVDLTSGNTVTLSNNECNFGYRDSIFKHKLKNTFLVTSVTFQLSRDPEVNTEYATLAKELDRRGIVDPTPQDVRSAVISVRQSRLPDWRSTPNAGSFFTNTFVTTQKYKSLQAEYPDIPGFPTNNGMVKIPTAWLLDQAGWKGVWHGNVGCYEKQPLIIVTNSKASGIEIVAFARDIMESIQRKFGLTLEPEVNIISYEQHQDNNLSS